MHKRDEGAIPDVAKSTEHYRAAFTDFYESLVDVHPEQFADGAPCRIGSTYKVPGAGGLDAQTFYMGHVLNIVFENKDVVRDLLTMARAAYNDDDPPPDATERVAAFPGLHEYLYTATEAAGGMTAKVGRWEQGSDLFANILTNVDCALQIAGIYDHTVEVKEHGHASSSGTMDQSAIDSLFD